MLRFLVCLLLTTTLGSSQTTPEPAAAPLATQANPAGTQETPESSPVEQRAESRADVTAAPDEEEPPEGYYAFVESPNATPPRVRPPPYRQVATECEEAHDPRPHVTANNLCGDLNRGTIPKNPMGHSNNNEPYPFELIRNHTLRFLSRTLPVLRADRSLPRVAHVAAPGPDSPAHYTNGLGERDRRSMKFPSDEVSEPANEQRTDTIGEQTGREIRDSRKFCDGGGVFCMLYRAINGESSSASGVERREDPGPARQPPRHEPGPGPIPSGAPLPTGKRELTGPPTPCPARVEYATPVFARNYQGVWRYVVQIPYEGYFTQTVEVTRCMQSRCHYLDGGCLSSPRWASLLVAELHYPPPAAAPPAPPAQPQDFQDYQQYLHKRAGVAGTETSTEKAQHCDGHDEMGCYQVRLYYDWFLVPGSCKCWRPDYFARYVRRRHHAAEL